MRQGKRGRIGKGYSLKDTNGTGRYFVYVWNPNSYEQIKWIDDGINKSNSKIKEWHCCGWMEDPKTWDEVKRYWQEVHEESANIDEMQEYFKDEFNRQEKDRKEKIMDMQLEIEALCTAKGLKIPVIKSIKSAKYHLNKLKKESFK